MFNRLWFRALLIISLGFCSYSFMLGAPFKTLDDQVSIIDNPIIHDTRHIKEIFTQGYFKDHTFYRPLVNFSYMLEYQKFGLNSFFYNLDNLLLHILNAFLVWMLVAILMESSSIGFWAALLFIIHPIHVEAVANISGRAILLSAGFVMGTFILFLKYLLQGNGIFLSGALLTFVLGVLCKESTIILPGVIFFFLIYKKKSVWILWPFAIVIACYAILRHVLGITEMFPWQNMSDRFLGLVSFLRSVLTDIRLFFVPIDLHFDRSQRVFRLWSEPEFLITMIVWAMIFTGLWTARRHIKPLIWFCLGWIALELFPVSQIITTIGVQPGRLSTADHFLYLLSIPVFILLIEGCQHLWQINFRHQWFKPSMIKFLVGGFIVFLFLFNIEQNYYSRNDFVMLRRSLQIQPENARLQSSLGLLYVARREFNKAEELFLKSVLADPMSVRYRMQFAQSICDQGRYQECLNIYNQISDPGQYEKMFKDNKQTALRLLEQHASILPK